MIPHIVTYLFIVSRRPLRPSIPTRITSCKLRNGSIARGIHRACHKGLEGVYLRPVYRHCEDLILAYSLTYPDFDLLSPFLSEAFPRFPGGEGFFLTTGDGDLDES